MNNDFTNEYTENIANESSLQDENVSANDLKHDERKRGTVKKFTHLSLNGLERMREDLSLSMSSGELAKCQSIYRAQKRDDVSTDEIYFLDSMIASRRTLPSSVAPCELYTNDSYIAATYADMMSKCTTLNIITDSPISINTEALLRVGSDYAKYSGRKGGYFTKPDSCEYSNVIGTSPLPIAPASKCEPMAIKNAKSSDLCFINAGRTTPIQAKRSNKKKTSIALLTSADGLPLTNERIYQFLSKDCFKNSFSAYVTVEDSLTASLRKLCGHYGVKIELDKLNVLGISEIFEIENGFFGLPLISYIAKSSKEINDNANSLGIKVIEFASVQKLLNLTVCNSGVTVFNAPLLYLESVFPKKIMPAKIPTVDFDVQNLDINTSTQLGNDDAEYDSIDLKDHIYVSSAHSALDNGYFSTLYSIIGAVSKLICKGVELGDISVSYEICTKYPTNELSFGNMLSLILGAYRAHAELSLVASKTSLQLCDNNTESISVFALAENKNANFSNVLFPTDSVCTYVAAPRISSNGIVDFNELREIWNFISSGKDEVIAVKALCAENVCDILNLPVDQEEISRQKSAIAFIIQSSQEMEIPHSTLINF